MDCLFNFYCSALRTATALVTYNTPTERIMKHLWADRYDDVMIVNGGDNINNFSKFSIFFKAVKFICNAHYNAALFLMLGTCRMHINIK